MPLQLLFRPLRILTLLVLLSRAAAQQFTDLPLPPAATAVSDSCSDALNLTVSCPGFLGTLSVENERTSEENLANLCTSTCWNSLQEVRNTIDQSCSLANDTIMYDDETYPATFIIDHFVYTYNLSCRRDPSTGKFCDTLLVEWLDQDSLTAEQECSDCMLGADETQLNSPFGYDEDFASAFMSKTKSCDATAYSFAIPGSYSMFPTGTNTTAVALPTATQTIVGNDSTCVSQYTVESHDTCNSIAGSNNVSTYSIQYLNGFMDSQCANLTAGADICLGISCQIYQVQPMDNCSTIIKNQGGTISVVQLLAWNTNIKSLCGNLYNLKNTFICISQPYDSINNINSTSDSTTFISPTWTNTTAATAGALSITTTVPKPTNALNQSSSSCAEWYSVASGDTCEALSKKFDLTSTDLLILNPSINKNCTNLLLGIAYCVEAVGTITTYSGYPTSSAFFTLTSDSYSTAVATTNTNYPSPLATATSQLPLAPGSYSNCTSYLNYVDVPSIQDQSQSTVSQVLTNYTNTCTYVVGAYDILLSELLEWNPILNGTNCMLASGYSYCVDVADAASRTGSNDTSSATASTTSRNSTQAAMSTSALICSP